MIASSFCLLLTAYSLLSGILPLPSETSVVLVVVFLDHRAEDRCFPPARTRCICRREGCMRAGIVAIPRKQIDRRWRRGRAFRRSGADGFHGLNLPLSSATVKRNCSLSFPSPSFFVYFLRSIFSHCPDQHPACPNAQTSAPSSLSARVRSSSARPVNSITPVLKRAKSFARMVIASSSSTAIRRRS